MCVWVVEVDLTERPVAFVGGESKAICAAGCSQVPDGPGAQPQPPRRAVILREMWCLNLHELWFATSTNHVPMIILLHTATCLVQQLETVFPWLILTMIGIVEEETSLGSQFLYSTFLLNLLERHYLAFIEPAVREMSQMDQSFHGTCK